MAHDRTDPIVRTELQGRGEALVLVPGGLTGMDSWRPHADRLAHDHRVIATQPLGAAAAPLHHDDDVARLARFERPTLLFKGIGSNEYEREIVDLIGQACPHARVEEPPGAHVLPLVSMEPFLAILTAFVAEHRSTY